MQTHLQKILNFSKLSTKDMYSLFKDCKRTIIHTEHKIKTYADRHNIITHCSTDHNISNEFKQRAGFYCSIARLTYESANNKRALILYKIRDSIKSYYPLLSANITTTTISTQGQISTNNNQVKLKKKFKNGRHDYELNDYTLKLVHLVRTIDANMTNK